LKVSARWMLPPGALALALAIVGSVGLHVPAYVSLGMLEELLDRDVRPPDAEPMEVEIVEAPQPEPEAEPPIAAEEERSEPPPEREQRERERPEEQRAEQRREEPEAPVVLAPPPPQLPPEPRRETSVAHRSRDPNVAPPENAEYLAEENSRVEEETMARIRSQNQDDPEPQLAAADEPAEASEDEGNAAEDEVANTQETEGVERLPVDETQGDAREASESPAPQRERMEQQRAQDEAGGGRAPTGGGEAPAEQEIVVRDPTGTYRIRVPTRPEGQGAGDRGGMAIAGQGMGREGEGRRRGRVGRGRGTPLRMSWSDFTSMYGEEELERERNLALERRRGRVRGVSREERWQRFRAAIENYDVQVRPGNQTALNTRADPFAAYLASMHRRIHVLFAEGFLRTLPAPTQAFAQANPTMHTRLEIGVGPDGNVARVGVVGTSGDTLFDFGAYNAVMGSQPFDATPSAIRSPDGIVYLHWSFYANERQCGTFNAQPYILAQAPTGTQGSTPPPNPLIDQGERIFGRHEDQVDD
jgi:hypothetical protein